MSSFFHISKCSCNLFLVIEPTGKISLVSLRLRDTASPHVHYQSFFMIRVLIFLNPLLSNFYAFLTSHKLTWNSNVVMET